MSSFVHVYFTMQTLAFGLRFIAYANKSDDIQYFSMLKALFNNFITIHFQ